MSWIEELSTGRTTTGEKVALPAGKYTDLELVSYIQKTSGPSKNDAELYRHAFLVASEGTDGTAFFDLRLKHFWLHPAVVALAFNSVEKAIAGGESETEIESTKELLRSTVARKVEAANTPVEQLEDTEEYTDEEGTVHPATKCEYTKGYDNLLTQIRIAVGTVFRLLEWKGIKQTLDVDIPSLVGAKFHGEVTTGQNGQSEVKSVYGKKAAKTATTRATA